MRVQHPKPRRVPCRDGAAKLTRPPPPFRNPAQPNTDGWGFSQMHQSSYSLKASVIGSIHAAHYFRAFLMVINAAVILVKLLSG